ncbi:neprilysin-2 [Dermacentor silvarum]|uniref:neprilysin-2 n=1 Tax=Dermacentor silvarum TaxID=543639 RepID=UPI002100B5EC|nr:neprilysin-2 [Dermacentor silvarum]
MTGHRGRRRDRSHRRRDREDRSPAAAKSLSPRRHRIGGRKRRSTSRRSSSASHSSSRSERGRRLAVASAAWLLAAALTVLGGVGIGMLAVRYADFFQRVATPAAPSPRSYRPAPRLDADGSYMDSPGFIKNKGADAAPVETCDSDVCLWEGRNLYEKFNESVNPCNDFYGYVCGSSSWYRDNQRIDTRPYRIHSPGQLMFDLADLQQRLYRLRRDRYQEQPTLFTNQVADADSFFGGCNLKKGEGLLPHVYGVEEIEDATVLPQQLHPTGEERVSLGDPEEDLRREPAPRLAFQEGPEDVEDLGHGHGPGQVRRSVRLRQGVPAQGPRRRRLRGTLEAPELMLKRHQLVYPNESVADYAKRVERLMSIFTDASMVKAAEDVVQLEQRLLQIKLPRRFLPYDNRTATIKELQRRNAWHWLTYLNFLLEDAGVQFHRQSSVVVLDREYVARLSLQLSKFSGKTLLNYLGYALIVKFSPLLPSDVDFVVPLSHENYLEKVPVRLQACVHMLEDLCPYLVRKMARMTIGRENATTPQWHYDEEMHKLIYLVRESMKQTVQRAPWLSQAEVDAASQKIDKLRVDFLAARESEEQVNAYYPQFVSPFPASDALLGYYKLLNETMSFYWITNSSYDLDARYQASSLVAGEVEYAAEKNLIFIPHGLIAFASNITPTFDPLFVPIIVPPILRAMFAAVDRRGSTVTFQNQVVNWWSNASRSKFASKLQCFQDQYAAEAQTALAVDIDEDFFLDENVADNAVLHPLHDVYRKAMHLVRHTPRDSRVPGLESLTMDKLFFVNYAMAHCDRISPNLDRRRVLYKDGVPAKLRVNVPLKNYPKFAEVFKCQRNAPMNPENRCELW